MNFTSDGLAMTERPKRPVQAYRNPGFLSSKDARELRILAEYLEPKSRFDFHYFFMRKFWFAYLAKAVIVFPGGYGTLDELFELLTLVQTRKMRKPLPMVLFGTEYWRQVVDFDALVRHGTIDARDVELVH